MQHIMQVLVAASRLVHGIRWNPSSFLPPCVCQGGTLTISITPEVVVILAFTLYLDLGSTVNSAWTGFYGTLLPVLNCWLMFSLYPDGVPWRQGGNQDGKEKQLLSLRMEPWARWGEAWRYIQQDLWLGGFLCFCAADVCLGFCHQCQDVCTVTWQAWSFSCYIVCRSISPTFGQPRPKPSSFRSWQAYFSMCDWLHTWGGLMFEMVLFGILRSFQSGPTSMKWVTYLIDYNVAWSHLNGSCQDVGKSESSTLCRRVAWRESSAKNETFTYSYACATSFKNSKQLLENTIVHYLTNFSLYRVKVSSLKQQGLCNVPKASPVWGPEAFWILLIRPFLAVVQQMFSWKLLKLVHWWAPS